MTQLRTFGLLAFAMLLITACGATTDTADTEAIDGEILIEEAWVRVASEGNTAAYMQIRNATASDVTLTGVTVEFAGMAQIHETTIEDDIARMRELSDGLIIPAGETATLEPGGVHLMLMNVQSALNEGKTAEITLTFDDGSTQTITADIRQTPPQDN